MIMMYSFMDLLVKLETIGWETIELGKELGKLMRRK